MLEQRGVWDNYLSLIEFTYNNSFHSSIEMTPFKVLYGSRCKTPLCLYECCASDVLGPEIMQQTSEKIMMIQEKMKVSKSCQKSYHDRRRKTLEFHEGDRVFL